MSLYLQRITTAEEQSKILQQHLLAWQKTRKCFGCLVLLHTVVWEVFGHYAV